MEFELVKVHKQRNPEASGKWVFEATLRQSAGSRVT